MESGGKERKKARKKERKGLKLCAKKQKKKPAKVQFLRQPRIERGAHRWQRWILPLNH